jgi:hypothetical protein
MKEEINLQPKLDKVQELSYFDEIGMPLIEHYTKELDDVMKVAHNYLSQNEEGDYNVTELQHILFKLATTTYFVSWQIEKIGALSDLSNMSYKEAFNTTLLEEGKDSKMTVAKLTAIAENSSIQENIINSIYARTYKSLKWKLDSASDLQRAIITVIKVLSNNNISDTVATKYGKDAGNKLLLEEF